MPAKTMRRLAPKIMSRTLPPSGARAGAASSIPSMTGSPTTINSPASSRAVMNARTGNICPD